MTTETADPAALFSRLLRHETRADPYPLYAALREQPIGRNGEGAYIVTRHEHISQLLRDPRMSANRRAPDDPRHRERPTGPDGRPIRGGILTLDPPEHNELRAQIVHHLAPRILASDAAIARSVASLLDAHAGADPGQIDVVSDLAYPLPVSVICEILGVPAADEPVFREFARKLTRGLDPVEALSAEEIAELQGTRRELGAYMFHLVVQRTAEPADDLISDLITGDGRIAPLQTADLIINLGLLLIAGHETTVNLIANGALALLRHPETLAGLRADPDLAPLVVEEVLRFDPPVQFSGRSTLAEIALGPTVIPQGSRVILMLAAGNRDPERFPHPERFAPGRENNTHLSFGSGIHYCLGAALARREAATALTALAQRLSRPRLLQDPPPYRENAILRGPEQLLVGFDKLT
jgi:cytochrome P450